MIEEEGEPVTKVDSNHLMKSILSRLDTLTSYFNLKEVTASQPEDR
mgnify:CR=1 FL=1